MFVIIRSCKWFNTKALTFDVDIFLAVLGAQWCWFNWRFNLRFLWNRSSFGRVWKFPCIPLLENLADPFFLIRFTFNGIARTWLRKWREILVQNSNFFFRIDHLLAETQTCAAAEQKSTKFRLTCSFDPISGGKRHDSRGAFSLVEISVSADHKFGGEVAKLFSKKTWRRRRINVSDPFFPLHVAIVLQGYLFMFTALAKTARVKLWTLRRSNSIFCYQVSVN